MKAITCLSRFQMMAKDLAGFDRDKVVEGFDYAQNG